MSSSAKDHGAVLPGAPAARGAGARYAVRVRGAPLIATFAPLAAAASWMLIGQETSGAAIALAAGAVWAAALFLSLKVLRLDPLSPAMIYLYLLGLFHLGLAVPRALGVEASPPPLWFTTKDLNPALALVLTAIASYLGGAAIAVWLWRPAPVPGPSIRCYNDALCAVGLAVVALGLLAFSGGVYSLGLERLLRSDYSETYELASHYDPRFFATSMTFVPLGLYLAVAAARRRFLTWVVGLGVLWGGCVLFLGFRGYALVPAITIFAVLHKRGVRLPRIAYLAGVFAVLAIIPLVRAARTDRLADRGVAAELTITAPLAAVEEMGGSLRALVHTIEFLENESFRWGRTYWQALRSAVPNVSFAWQGGEYLPLEQLPPSHWMTLQAAPHTYRAHGGLGFSAIAEPYMNFGVPGVAVYFFFLAALLVAAYRGDAAQPTRLALWAVVLGPLLWTVRNDFHGFFRPVLLGIACLAAARLLTNSLPFALSRSKAEPKLRRAIAFRTAGLNSVR
jgi:uncharacterized membrane protein